MNLINKLFGFKTKNLYLGKLKYSVSYVKNGENWYGIRTYSPNKYVLVRKKEYDLYTDIFTKSEYPSRGKSLCHNKKVMVDDLNPIVSNKRRIKYKDAEEILKTKNTIYIKN